VSPPPGPADAEPRAALDPAGILVCPYCRSALRPLERTLRCERGHSFDVTRQGYVNLLAPSRRHAKDPGDNRAMIVARRRFLDGGLYDQIADRVNDTVTAKLPSPARPDHTTILDAGAGEGFYLARLSTHLQGERIPAYPALYGVDVSKHGMQYATHRTKAVTWLVASIVDLPIAGASIDLILSAFAPLAPAEFQRVLRPTGTLVVVEPGPEHLIAVRERLYATVLSKPPDPVHPSLLRHFALRSSSRLTYGIVLPAPTTVSDLLTMTPFGWNVDAATRLRVEGAAPLPTEVDVFVRVYAPK
jgi:23S rRNA (guanine745-N1)-methyltransferase